jgi:clan AA aspartic protease
MIVGSVNARREAVLVLAIRIPDTREESIEVLIDTGFSGELTLPRAVIARFGLPWHHDGRAVLADDSELFFPVHQATVFWDGSERRVAVDQVNASPMIGMKLLDGSELAIQVRSGGSVVIKALPGV